MFRTERRSGASDILMDPVSGWAVSCFSNKIVQSLSITYILGVKGKERQAVSEVYELFDSVSLLLCIIWRSLLNHWTRWPPIYGLLTPIHLAILTIHQTNRRREMSKPKSPARCRLWNGRGLSNALVRLLRNKKSDLLTINCFAVNCQTNTPCGSILDIYFFGWSDRAAIVLFMSCKPPVNPVELIMKHMKNIEESGITRTR